jgi:hypothetical protein
MNSFSTQIRQLENDKSCTYEIRTGSFPVIITSAHGIRQKKRNGKFKFGEPYTRGIAKYVSRKTDCFCLIKNEDTGVDPNKKNEDEFKTILADLVEKNRIKLVIDLHGAKAERDFDVEIGTRDGKMAKQETVDKLIECLNKAGIKNVVVDDPFKGGQITQATHDNTSAECLQLEINYKYRNIRKIQNLNRICRALANFVSGIM